MLGTFISLCPICCYLAQNATQRATIADLSQQPLILTYAKPAEGPPAPLAGPTGITGERFFTAVLFPIGAACLCL